MRGLPALPRRAAPFLAAALAAAALAPGRAEAGFIGDPTLTNGAGRFSLSAEVDLTERDLDFDGGADVEIETSRLFVTGAYGFGPSVDGFVKIGFWGGELNPGPDIDNNLGIGFGVKGAFVDRGEIRLGALGQFGYFSSELDSPPGPDIDWYEFDLAVAASFRGLGQIVPYVGAKLSLVDGEVEGGGDFEQDDTLGVFGGVSFAASSQVLLGAEVRLLDENAVGLVARFLF